MYTLEELKINRDIWCDLEIIPAQCTWCNKEFEVKYGTLYNIIRRDAEGLFCCRKCSGAARASNTQEKFLSEGGKTCKRCGEFKDLENFSSMPSPPYFRAECKRCHNYKPARKYSSYKDKAQHAKLKFNLSLDEFIKFWVQNCYYCSSDSAATRLELIDISKGYTFSNIVSCCRQCQKFKNDMHHFDFINLCHLISGNVKESEDTDE